jgi:multiple sugar transport system substrate-binding protein
MEQNMKHKLFLFLILTALILSACNGATATTAPDAGDTGDTAGDTTNNTSGGEKITLRVWAHQNNSFNAADQAMIDQFIADNPNVEIKFETFPWDVFIQTIQTSVPAGNAADIIQLPGGYTCRFASGGQLLEVPADVISLSAAQEMFFNAPLGGQTCDGKLYGFPVEYNLEYGGAYVNPALFEAAGVAYPPQWETWDDVVADAEKLTQVGSDGVMTVAGLHYTNSDQLYTYFLAGILEQGVDYFAEDGRHFNFNSPEAVATIQKLMDMAQTNQIVDPIIFNADSEWVGESFAQGHNAIGVLGSWYAGEAKISYPDLTFDYVTLPPMVGTEHRFASVGGWGIAVSKSTTNPDVAWKLAAFMGANQENALMFNTTTGTIPGMKAVAADPKLLEAAPFLAGVLPILDGGQYQGNVTDADLLAYEIIYPTILNALQGNLTAEEAAQSIHEAANAMVDESQ